MGHSTIARNIYLSVLSTAVVMSNLILSCIFNYVIPHNIKLSSGLKSSLMIFALVLLIYAFISTLNKTKLFESANFKQFYKDGYIEQYYNSYNIAIILLIIVLSALEFVSNVHLLLLIYIIFIGDVLVFLLFSYIGLRVIKSII